MDPGIHPQPNMLCAHPKAAISNLTRPLCLYLSLEVPLVLFPYHPGTVDIIPCVLKTGYCGVMMVTWEIVLCPVALL